MVIVGNSFAFSPEKRLADQAQEARALALFSKVRCLVCQGQTIDTANTQFAFELKTLIREQIASGKTDQEIEDDLSKRFGKDIFISAQLSSDNFILWAAPLIFAALIGFYFFYKRK